MTFGMLFQLPYNDVGPLLCLGFPGRRLLTGGKRVEVIFFRFVGVCEATDKCVEHVCVTYKPVEVVIQAIGFLCQFPPRLVGNHMRLRQRHPLVVCRLRCDIGGC